MSTDDRDQREIASLAWQVNEGLRRTSAYSVLFNQAIAEQLGINATDLRCLDFVSREDNVTAGRLAELTGLTTGAITGVVDRLERAELAERRPDPHDRRRVIIAVLEGAGRRVGPLFESLGNAMLAYCAQFSAEDLRAVVEFINGLEPIMQEETMKARAAVTSEGSG